MQHAALCTRCAEELVLTLQENGVGTLNSYCFAV